MARVLGVGLALAWGGSAVAQNTPTPAPVLTIEQERLFTDTQYGRAVQARIETSALALQAENRRIDDALEAEEKALTERRVSLPPEEFRPLAEVFDAKVEGIRAAQEAKGRALSAERDRERQKVLEAALPILTGLMQEMGAVAILRKETVFLSFERNDVTDAAIQRIDQLLGDGSTPVAPTPPQVPENPPAP